MKETMKAVECLSDKEIKVFFDMAHDRFLGESDPVVSEATLKAIEYIGSVISERGIK
jgi:hypothetical protein